MSFPRNSSTEPYKYSENWAQLGPHFSNFHAVLFRNGKANRHSHDLALLRSLELVLRRINAVFDRWCNLATLLDLAELVAMKFYNAWNEAKLQ